MRSCVGLATHARGPRALAVRRLAPRPLSAALEGVVPDVAPATLLARVQGVWSRVAGAGLAAAAYPVSERDGVITIACESGVWAHELELLAPELLPRLNSALGAAAEGPSAAPAAARLRFVTGSVPNRP
jgi:predicted nucleic acid-binding Zn ribbon protein